MSKFVSFLAASLTAATVLLGCGGVDNSITKVHEYAYVANGAAIKQFIVSDNGQLTPLSTPTVTAAGATNLARSGNGRYLYATSRNDAKLYQFSINSHGLLSPLTPASVDTGSTPTAVAVSTTGFVYVLNSGNNTISQFSTTGGAVSPLTPATVSTAADGSSLAITPDGKYLYSSGYSSSEIDAFSIGVDGKLTPLATPSYSVGGATSRVTISPDGKSAYALTSTAGIFQYIVNSDGSLTANGSIPSEAVGADAMGLTLDNRFAYVGCFNSGLPGGPVGQYSVDSTGALTPLVPSSVAAGNAPVSIAVSATGQFVYVANQNSGDVSQFAIGSDGTLTPLSPAAVATGGALEIVLARR